MPFSAMPFSTFSRWVRRNLRSCMGLRQPGRGGAADGIPGASERGSSKRKARRSATAAGDAPAPRALLAAQPGELARPGVGDARLLVAAELRERHPEAVKGGR